MTDAAGPGPWLPRAWSRALRYPREYAWYILAGTLDIVVTHFILQLGGHEVNILADRLIERFGVWGLVALKYGTVVLVVLICEAVGRTRPRVGRALARAAVVISAFPVGLGLLKVYAWTHAM